MHETRVSPPSLDPEFIPPTNLTTKASIIAITGLLVDPSNECTLNTQFK